jgi:hypothetical protein
MCCGGITPTLGANPKHSKSGERGGASYEFSSLQSSRSVSHSTVVLLPEAAHLRVLSLRRGRLSGFHFSVSCRNSRIPTNFMLEGLLCSYISYRSCYVTCMSGKEKCIRVTTTSSIYRLLQIGNLMPPEAQGRRQCETATAKSELTTLAVDATSDARNVILRNFKCSKKTRDKQAYTNS